MKLSFIYSKYILLRVAATLAALWSVCGMHAASPEKYASSSVLSQGKWVKINVSNPGLQTISAQTLKNFGFSNPAKVNVYGYGGRMVPEALRPDLPDDLPMQPVVRQTDGGLSFYAVGNHTWTAASGSSEMRYSHSINPYSETSYYFLSDRDMEAKDMEVLDMSDIDGLEVMTEFTEHLVHERDLMQCATSGRHYLGEDFRLTKSQNFGFELPDNVTGSAKVRVSFAANTSGAPSSIIVSANGTRLNSTSSDKLSATTASSQYYQQITTTKNVAEAGEKLTVGIEYSQGGVVNMARLNWIEVEYGRRLAMRDSRLAFHVAPLTPSAYRISGVTSRTLVWDVTDPAVPKEVKGYFDATAGTLTLGIKTTGYREFIAFEPEAKGATLPGKYFVANQDLHSLPTPDMLIISPDEYASAAERIARLHRETDGMTVHVISPEDIYNEFSSGNADLSAFRKILKMWHDRGVNDTTGHSIRYCLIMGRPTYDQKLKNQETINGRYPRPLIWQSSDGLSESTSYCTDDFIGMLEDETRVRAHYDRTINVAVGRYPVKSVDEAETVAEKLEKYVYTPDYGQWRNNVLVIADDNENNNHLDQADSAIKNMMTTEAGANYAYERLYLDSFELKMTGTGLEYPDATARLLRKWEKEGVAFINYIGHANPKEWGHEKLLTWTHINALSNQQLPVLYAATCSFGHFDGESVSGAEVMLLNQAGGVVSVVTPSRSVYISLNGKLNDVMSQQVFAHAPDGKGQTIGDIMRKAKTNYPSRDDNMYRYHLMGDPAMRMPVPQYSVRIDSLAGRPLAATLDDAPIVEARSKVIVKGRITDSKGTTVDFNGPVEYTLFDAEVSVHTHGNGDQGKPTVYQDRNTKLAVGSTMAVNGEWTAVIFMPTEITNNFTPARITLYAYDPKSGSEANGSTENLYVYGFDEDSAEDSEGPQIEKLYLNNAAFTDGGMTGVNSIVLATVSDDSGINTSDAGIGHRMSLVLDNVKTYDDVSNYFTSNPLWPGSGTIAYPLQNLEPGKHEVKLTVWDNANNSSSRSISFTVGLNMRPQFADFSAYYSREADNITISLTTDRPMCKLDAGFECFDLSGAKVWDSRRSCYSGKDSNISSSWDMRDSNGSRVARGIYILRATVTDEDGLTTTESRKIAVP